MKKEREFIYNGDLIPKFTKSNHSDFILHYQKSVLSALVKRNLLSTPQAERVIEALEYQQYENSSGRQVKDT